MCECTMTTKAYKCTKCGKEVITSEVETPECCGQEMEQIPLEQCTQPHEAEYSGPFEEDEPCDTGRSGP
jgi:DNA-directed RNA polymerase subunit RPC12/RpoP